MGIDSTQRFGDRAGDYAKARPSYPREVFDFLAREFGLAAGQTAADLGSGTGISTALLLDRGLRVYAVEPNASMRAAAESALGGRPGFVSIGARAETTTLSDASADWAFAAQAFHWFDAEAARAEVRRILKPGGCCALMWNERQTEVSAFSLAYESFLVKWGVDYERVKASYQNTTNIAQVLGPGYIAASFPHAQDMDSDLFRARTLSASYLPKADTDRGRAMMIALDNLFARFQEHGLVRFDYLTNLYCARIV